MGTVYVFGALVGWFLIVLVISLVGRFFYTLKTRSQFKLDEPEE